MYTLDEDRLADLAPDVIVTQEACEVCAVSYDQVAAAVRRATAGAQIVAPDPDPPGSHPRGRAAGGGRLRRSRARRGGGRRPSPPADGGGPRTSGRPRVAVIEWLAPVMLAGHWVPDSIRAAGGIAVGPEPGAPSPYSTWDEMRALEPDAVVVAPCGFDLDRTRLGGGPLRGPTPRARPARAAAGRQRLPESPRPAHRGGRGNDRGVAPEWLCSKRPGGRSLERGPSPSLVMPIPLQGTKSPPNPSISMDPG